MVMTNAAAPQGAADSKSAKKKQIYLGSSYDLASTYSGGATSGVTAQIPDGAETLANGLVHAKSTGSLFSGGFKKIKHALK